MQPELCWLDDPRVFRVNQLTAHSDHRFFESRDLWLKGEDTLSQSLDGEWEFFWSPCAGKRPERFFEEDFDASGFGKIGVPGHIELAGYDKIHYINTMYPWEGQIYRRPWGTCGREKGEGSFSGADYNPVGSYRLRFDLKESLWGKRVRICFEGVEQAMYLWLNGQFVGYAEDSFTPSEFDLTPYIRREGNLLAVEVHKRSSAAYLEDQDFFRFSGIFRSVTLYGLPRIHVEDLWARPRLADGGKGRFSLELKLSAESWQEGARVEYELEGPDQACVLKGEKPAAERVCFGPEEVPSPVLWENGSPSLYKLTVRVFGPDGREAELVPYEVGFRSIRIEDGVMKLNGRRLLIKGVNRHEWNPDSGRVISMEDMVWDMECLKRNHINSVRTCHYPDRLEWYAMCDREGIYVMAETNLESHGSWQKMGAVEPSWNVPGSLPQWREAVLDRARTHFETLKNHVSILFWSLGNESYAGTCIRDMGCFFQERDPDRLVHYEGVFHCRRWEDEISQMESQMYAPPGRIRDYLEHEPKKPFIVCEFMHDMGNSLGGLGSYMELFDRYEMYQGGYIWDFIDQALYAEDEPTGRRALRYGGDFDDRPSDYEFSGNGIVFADRREKPAMQEVRYYYGKYK